MHDPSVDLVKRNRSFTAYWIGQSVASGGHQVTVLALPLVSAITLGVGPAAVGAVASAAMLPYLLFSLVAGHVLEGRDHKRVMIPADLAQAILLAAVPIAWAMDWLSVPLLIVIAFLTGIAAVAFGVSAFAYLPSLVEEHELAAANRAVQGSGTMTEVAGPGLAGLLVSWLGPPLAILADSLSYLASALGVAGSNSLHRTSVQPVGSEGKPSITTGLKILFQNRYLRALTIHAALYNLAEQIFFLNLVIWAIQQQDVSAVGYGLALSAAGVGGLLGTITALHLADRLGLGRAFAASLVLSCIVPLLTAMWPLRGLSLALVIGAVMFVSGIGLANANVYSLTLRQIVIPNSQLSRSAGAYTQVMYGSIPIGSALAGVIGSTLGTRAGVTIGALGLLLSMLPMLTRRVLRLDTAESARPSSSGTVSTQGLPVPVRNTVARRIAMMHPVKVGRSREGADLVCRLQVAGETAPQVSAPLEQVEIDHAVADLIIVDERARQPSLFDGRHRCLQSFPVGEVLRITWRIS